MLSVTSFLVAVWNVRLSFDLFFILQCIYTLALLFSSMHIHSCFIVFVVGSLLSWYGISYVGFNTYTFAVCLLIGCLERLRAIFCFAGESVRVVIDG